MTDKEFLDGFEVLYNNITSNQAPGLNVYEICWFLTKAQLEIVKNHYTANSKGNNLGQGYDDSAKRQADFSMLMETANCGKVEDFIKWHNTTANTDTLISTEDITIRNEDTEDVVSWFDLPRDKSFTVEINTENLPSVTINGVRYELITTYSIHSGDTITNKSNVRIDSRSNIFKYPSDMFLLVNEVYNVKNTTLQVIALKFDAYTNYMSKPYKRPVRNQAWKLINSGRVENGEHAKYVEIIAGPGTDNLTGTYTIRYIRKPKPIIVGELDGQTIDGYCYTGDGTPNTTETSGCELDPSLHDEILQRAVELAKAAWTSVGNDNIQAITDMGQRSE